MVRVRKWGMWVAAVGLLLPLCRSAAQAQGSPKSEPLIAPEEMLSVDEVRPGMKGYGRSVFEGTKIENFNITVIGVLRKIDFGGDMVLVRIEDGPPVTTGSGVSQGMSGSPIYVDGKLIGALAFAWPFAKQPIAGVTPISQMLENYRPGSAPAPPRAQAGDLRPQDGPLKLDGKLFARASVVPERGMIPSGAAGTLYLAPVGTPVMVSGMSRPTLDHLRKRFSRHGAMLAPAPGKTDLPEAEKPKIEPGSAVGVQLLGGDIDATAIGTVTYVKGDHVLAFGHPMFGLGTIDMPMTTAYIHGVISSQEVSFKMGSPVDRVGTVSQDRNWAIGGRMGTPSRMVDAEFAVRDEDRGVHRQYKVQAAVHRDLTPQLLYGALLSAVGSVSPADSGTTRGTLEVWPKGMPVIRRENVFSVSQQRSQLEQLFGDPFASMPLAELLQILSTLENNTFGAVPVERIRVSVDVSEKKRTATIERAYADRKRVKPGDKVKIGVVIQPADAPKQLRELEVEIPRNIPGGRVQIGVAGGSSAGQVRQVMQITRPPAKSLTQLLAQIAEREQNNELTLEVAQPVVGVSVSGREFPNLPNVVVEVLTGANPSGIRMVRTHTQRRQSTPWVLSGAALLSLQVEADEKDKSGTALAPFAGGLGGFGSLLDLFRLGFGGGDLSDAGAGDTGEGALFDGGDEESDAAARARLLRALAAQARRQDAPNDPKTPTFEELQRILDEGADATTPAATEGGAATTVSKGLAREPGVWRARSAKDFKGGKLEGVLVSSRGELALAPQAKTLLSSPDRFFWAQTTDASGSVYVGGWLEGDIVKIGTDGKHATFFDAKGEVAISALTSDADGTIYAAAEPSGSIYRVAPNGQGTVLCKLEGQRVWALKKVGDSLYIGTGSEGRLYRVGPDGKPVLAFTAPDRHLFALADDGKGGLYAGTYPRGKVFHIQGEKVAPVYELPAATVTALACDKQGNLYIGTSPKATVVKLTPAGDATTLFQSTEKHVFSLLVDDGGSVYAGVGGQAKVYRIAPDRTVSTLWEPQASYVLSLSRDAGGSIFATTAGPTQIVRLSGQPAGTGTFISPVLNAGSAARWGVVRWSGPPGVRLYTRSGNTAYPDSTWSDWSQPHEKSTGEPVTSPPGQYLQYRVVLEAKAGGPSPTLGNLELFYRARNRAPEVTVKAPAAGDVLSGTRPIRWSAKDPDGDRLSYEIYYAKEGTDRWVKIGSRTGPGKGAEDATETIELPDLSAVPAPARLSAAPARRGAPRRAVAVSRLSRRVRMQAGKASPAPAAPANPPSQVPAQTAEAEQDLDAALDELGEGGAALTWNTKRVPDGRYRLKIVANDSLTSPDQPANGEIISDAVLVDNTGPRLLTQAATRVAQGPPAEIPVSDAGTYVASAEYRVGTGEWIAAAAGDGIFDSAQEVIKLNPARLKPGRNIIEIRARDAAANVTTARVPYFLAPAAKAP